MDDEVTRCVQEINEGKNPDGKTKKPWMSFEDFWRVRSQQVKNGVGCDKVTERLNKDGLPPRLARSLAENGIESKKQFVQFITEAEKVWWYGAYGRLEFLRGCKKVGIQKLAKWAGVTITKRKSRGVPPSLSERQRQSWAVVQLGVLEDLHMQNAALRADKERLDKLEKMLVDAKILPIGGNEPIEERYLRLGILRGKTMRQFLDSVSGE